MNKTIWFIGVFIVLIVVVYMIGANMTGNVVMHTNENFETFKNMEIQSDKCAVPPGTNEENWREHMSHHPEMYKECL